MTATMTTKTPVPVGKTPHPWQTGPLDTQERLRRIEMMGQWVNGYVQFMCQTGNPNAASAAVTDKAVAAFYEQMVVLERRLARIHEAFCLE